MSHFCPSPGSTKERRGATPKGTVSVVLVICVFDDKYWPIITETKGGNCQSG